MTPDRTKAARDLLTFYAEAGADAPLGEAPLDRLAETPPQPSSKAASQPAGPGNAGPAVTPPVRPAVTPSAVPPPPPPDAALMAARAAAKSAATLEELRAILERFEGCALRATAKQLVFADGNPQSRLMFVGEAPGRDEDIEGLPFVGRSGKLLDRMLAAIGLDRSSVYIANIVPWRPPGNRTPTPQEAATCLPFTLRQIELVNPDVLVCLGGPVGADAAALQGRHPENARALVSVSHRHARDPRPGDVPPRLSAAHAAGEAARLARFPGDQEGAGYHLVLRRTRSGRLEGRLSFETRTSCAPQDEVLPFI